LDNTCKYLILLPTRELTLQVYQNFKEIFNAFSSVKALSEEEVAVRQKIKKIRLLMTIGGIPFEDDRKKYLQEGGNIIIGTIGRVLEFIDKRLIKLNELRMLVLDEGDKLFENRNKKLSDVLAQVLTQKEE
jgi:superfamily II DNA/RNA helicase